MLLGKPPDSDKIPKAAMGTRCLADSKRRCKSKRITDYYSNHASTWQSLHGKIKFKLLFKGFRVQTTGFESKFCAKPRLFRVRSSVGQAIHGNMFLLGNSQKKSKSTFKLCQGVDRKANRRNNVRILCTQHLLGNQPASQQPAR